MPKVSVIVPVYNTEKYIDKCLNSLANQTLDDYEVLVINDGTPDNSQKIIDNYVKKYPHIIKSYIKKNGGLSDARNYGIKKAKGEFLSFVDSDDYVSENMLFELYNKAINNNYDIVVCDINYVYDNKIKNVSSLIDNDILCKDEIKKVMINVYPAAWNKLYKKSLFDSGILFKKGVWYEDVEFLYRIFPYVNSIGTVKKGLYNYVQRDNSIISTFDKRLYNYIDNWNGIISFYKKNNIYDEYFDILEYCYCRYILMTFIKGCTKFSKADYEDACQEALKNVENNFPNYKKNKYLHSVRKFYIKHFKSLKNLLYAIMHK